MPSPVKRWREGLPANWRNGSRLPKQPSAQIFFDLTATKFKITSLEIGGLSPRVSLKWIWYVNVAGSDPSNLKTLMKKWGLEPRELFEGGKSFPLIEYYRYEAPNLTAFGNFGGEVNSVLSSNGQYKGHPHWEITQ